MPRQALNTTECKFNFRCKESTRDCSPTCYICNWLVREWPLFQEASLSYMAWPGQAPPR